MTPPDDDQFDMSHHNSAHIQAILEEEGLADDRALAATLRQLATLGTDSAPAPGVELRAFLDSGTEGNVRPLGGGRGPRYLMTTSATVLSVVAFTTTAAAALSGTLPVPEAIQALPGISQILDAVDMSKPTPRHEPKAGPDRSVEIPVDLWKPQSDPALDAPPSSDSVTATWRDDTLAPTVGRTAAQEDGDGTSISKNQTANPNSEVTGSLSADPEHAMTAPVIKAPNPNSTTNTAGTPNPNSTTNAPGVTSNNGSGPVSVNANTSVNPNADPAAPGQMARAAPPTGETPAQ